MIGIYKIENLVNGKVYIGQSIHIERRWQEHCQPSSRSLIGKAIQKYGKEHFTFQVLDECAEEYLDELEERYISVYNSVVPNGYNIETASKGKTSFVFYDQEVFTDIVKDIVSSDLTLIAIAEKYALQLSDRARDIREADLKSMAVVIGSEGRGVRQQILEQADAELIIPMNAHCESLNAAVAATIVMWQMAR